MVAAYDRREDRARSLASELHATAYAGELDEMLRKERLDAVSICTPPWLHAGQAQVAFEAGVHVLTEKPMAMTAAECDAMCAAARRAGRKLCVSHNFLFSRSVSEVRRRIAEGRLGRVEAVLGFQMSTPRRRLPDWYEALPGQLFFDEAPHLTYLSRAFLAPGEPELVSASALQGDASAVQRTQNVVAVLKHPAGMGVLSMTFNASRAEWGLAVVGSAESYIIDLFRDQLLVLGLGGRHTPGEVLRQTVGGLAQMTGGAIVSGSLYAARRLLYGHRELVGGFLNAVAHDADVPVPGEEGTRTIGLLEAICRKADLLPQIPG